MADRALLVGINEYAEAPLRGCINDVSDVRDLLIASCGFAQSDVRLLLDRQATTANIREALNQWLVADPGEHDRLFFHFSGHGTQLPGRDGVVRDVICPADFDFTESRSLSEVDFSGIFGSLPAGARFVWISDSCHSGELARGPVRHDAIPRYLPPPPQIMAQIDTLMVRGAAKRNLNSIAASLKGVLIAGCQAHETSADAQFNGRYNGALSYFLLQALRSQTGASEDINSVLQRVQGVLKREGFSQHPQLRGIADLQRRPFLMFRGLQGEALASVQPVAPDPGNVEAAASIGDGRYWDDAFETETTPRANPGWSIVQWQANDEKNVDYRHLAGSRYKNAQFEFTADDLELLIKANLFEPFRDRGKIIFALRGAELVAARSASPDDRFRQVARAALSLKETRPDHQKFRCVIGVYDARERTLSGFIASTVPCRQAVHSYANGGAPSNLLPTGCYQMVVGDHKGRIGCLIEGENFTVLRTKRDCLFDTEDVWDNTFPGDNLHPAFANGSAEFSSWGCQTIRGNCPPGTDAFTGEYKEFRRALGLRPGTADYGAKFSYVLLTGLEAATANILKDAALPQLTRLRHGSRGEPVRLLQERLSAATDGKFGAKLTKALADHQKKQLGWADGIYCAEMDVLLRLDVFGAQRPQAAPAEPSPVASPAIAPTPVAAYAPHDLPMSAPLAPLVQKIGSVCHIWDYPNRSCREKTDVWQVEGTQAAHFLSKLQVDADGAPRAYHPSDRSPPGNAGKAFDWLANLGSSDRHGIQGENGAVGPAAGFVISATSLVDGRFPVNDTRRYVDASSIPYVVLPKSTFPVPAGMSLKMGCVVCVVDTKTGGYSGAIFADVGRAAGEGSIRLAQRLGVTPFSSSRWPKVVGFSGGANDRRFFYLVFPASVVPAPWAVDEIQARADALFQAWGGKERLKSIVPSLPDVLPPVTVFNEEPPSTRELTADEEAGALRRLRSLDVSKEELSDHENDVRDEELDRGPVPGKLEPDADEPPREGAGDAHSDVGTPAPIGRASRPLRLLEADIRRFAPKALQGSLDALVRDGPTELGLLGIDADPLRLCHFMAQIGHECGGFTIKSESLNYTTTARLRAVWPSRFPDDASARPFLRNEEKLAEKVYGGRLGNVKRGDGYRYRGRGFVQITGRAAYREMGEKLKLPLEENPDLALEPAVALKIACRTWADKTLPGERGMNELADANKIEALTYRINGGYTNLEDRRAEFRKAWQIWGEGAAPDKVLGIEQLERGDRGTPVARLARDLRDLGYGTAGTSSIFGSNAYAAVRRFQQDHGLPVTGVAGPDTLAAVEEALGRKQAGRTSREGGSPREMARDAAPRRQALLVRSVRIFAAGLAMLAALFGFAYLMSLGRPEYFGPLAMWLPLTFAGLVFIGAFLIGHWGTMIASSQPGERGMRQPADVPAGDAEPVRDGIASAEAD